MTPVLAAMLIGGLGSWLLRGSFLVLLRPERIPPPVQRLLAYALPASLGAILVDAVVHEMRAEPAVLVPQLSALTVASIVAWRRRSLTWTLVAGIAVFVAVEAVASRV